MQKLSRVFCTLVETHLNSIRKPHFGIGKVEVDTHYSAHSQLIATKVCGH